MQDFAKWLIVTDLDGTLLGHHDYAFDDALPALKQLADLGFPVIFNTSKTRHEILTLRQRLHNHDPFIVENGSAIFIPQNPLDKHHLRQIETGLGLPVIRQKLAEIRLPEDDFLALPDLSVAKIMHLTGLNDEQAKAAASRDYSFPIIWQGDEPQQQDFIQRLRSKGLEVLQGGRFLHVQGDTDKATAMKVLRDLYPDHGIAALGDSGNDLAMLQAAEVAMVIRSPGNQYLPKDFRADYISKQPAPAGWAEAIEFLLTAMKL